jgi:hypothetical protein
MADTKDQGNNIQANPADIEKMTGSSIPAGGHQGPYAKHVTATKVGDHRQGYRHSAPDKTSLPKGRR